MATFQTTGEIVEMVCNKLASALPAHFVQSGSHQSPSTYFTQRYIDEFGDDEVRFCIRVSDHEARSCTSKVHHSILIYRDLCAIEINDEDDDFMHFQVDDWRIDDVVADAVAAAQS